METSLDFTRSLGRSWAEPDVDIVTIHGLCRAGREPWDDTDERPGWLEKDLFEKRDMRLIVFNYAEEDEDGLVLYSKRGIDAVARKFLDSLMSWRVSDEESSSRPLAFVSHDFGGTILKQAMVLASRDPEKYRSILNSTYALIFINCPHRPASHASLSDSLAALICDTKRPSSGILKTAEAYASTIIETNDEFNSETTILLQTRVASVCSEHPSFAKRVFDRLTATFGVASETVVPLSGPHATLLCGEEGRMGYMALRETLEFPPSDYDISVWAVREALGGFRFLQSLVVPQPIYRLGEQPKPGYLDDFEEWMRESEQHHRPRCILTNKDRPLPIDSITSLLKRWQEGPGRPKVVMFAYDFSNLKSFPRSAQYGESGMQVLLTTLLVQAIAYILPRTSERAEPPPKVVLDRLKSSQGLIDYPSLLGLFEDINIWLKQSGVRAIWAIWNVHKCIGHDEPAVVVRRLTECLMFSEFKPTILFVGPDGPDHRLGDIMKDAEVTSFGEVSLDDPLHGITDAPEVEDLKSLLQRRPGLRHTFNEVVDKTDDSPLIRVLARWARDVLEDGLASKVAEMGIASLMSTACTKPQRLFQAILESLSVHQKTWAIRLLRWVMYSLRPLSPAQVAEALFLEDTENPREERLAESDEVNHGDSRPRMLRSLQQCLYGMIEVEDNQVRLSHPAISELLSSPGSKWYIHPVEAHLHILECLFSQLSMRAASGSADLQASPSPFLPPYNLTWYAVHYWPEHYKIVRSNPSTAQSADRSLKGFLENRRDAVRYWCEAHSPTPVGLNATAQNLIFLIRSGVYGMTEMSSIFDSELWMSQPTLLFTASEEAVQCGHLDLLSTLPVGMMDIVQVRAILTRAAKANAKAEVLNYLFHQAKDPPSLPQSFLARLVQVGAVDPVREVCGSGVPGGIDNSALLLEAVRARQAEITDILLKLDGVRPPEDDDDHGVLDAMQEACRIGNPTLLRAMLRFASLKQRYTTLLPLACAYGNHAAVKELLADFSPRDMSDDHRSHLLESSALKSSATNGALRCTQTILEYYDVDRDKTNLLEVLLQVLEDSPANMPQQACRLLFDTGIGSFSEDYVLRFYYTAIGKGDLEMVKLIEDNCGGVNALDSDGIIDPPLYTAASQGHLPIVQYLLDRGADINARCSNGGTAVYIACIENHPEIVRLLLTRGADVTLDTYNRHWSPLEGAYDLPEVLEELVTHAKPPPDYKRLTNSREVDVTALFLAVKDNQEKSVGLILDHGDPDLEFAPAENMPHDEVAGLTPLSLAASKGFPEIARRLLEKGADINRRVGDRAVPILHHVTSEATMAVLLEYNPELEAKDSDGYSVINHIASQENHWPDQPAILRRLANAGANLESCDNYGDTPLNNAVLSSNIDAMRCLVAKGAKLNTLKPETGSPVHRAAAYGRLEPLAVLVGEMGADANAVHNMIGSPLQAACTAPSDVPVVQYLVDDAGAEVNPAGGSAMCSLFGQACLTGSPGALRYLLECGMDTAVVDRTGKPSFYNLCFRRMEGVVVLEELLSRDAEICVSKRDILGRNILHAAVLGGSISLVEKLLELQPELLKEKDGEGWTALHWAARRAYVYAEDGGRHPQNWEEYGAGMVELLLQKGCPGLEERVAVGGKMWLPEELARYHGAPESVLTAFRSGGWDGADGEIDAAMPYGTWSCDCCYAEVRGPLQRCKAEECRGRGFGLCFRCFPHRSEVHDAEHEFEELEETLP